MRQTLASSFFASSAILSDVPRRECIAGTNASAQRADRARTFVKIELVFMMTEKD